MDIFSSLFNSGKNTLASIFNAVLNSPCILSIINSKIERYANISEINKEENGFFIKFKLLNTDNDIVVKLREVCLSEDRSTVSLHGFQSDTMWLQHILEDFVENKEFMLPDNELIRKVISLL